MKKTAKKIVRQTNNMLKYYSLTLEYDTYKTRSFFVEKIAVTQNVSVNRTSGNSCGETVNFTNDITDIHVY